VTPFALLTSATGFGFLCHILWFVFGLIYVCLCFNCDNILYHFYKKSSLIQNLIVLEKPTLTIINKYSLCPLTLDRI
jgi:hypothetical protein